MTDQGWSNWWCEWQRYGVVAVAAAAAAIRGWRNQTESTHRRVAMSCWPCRRGKSCSGKDRRRNQEKYQDALLTVVGGRGECMVRTASTWRGARGGDWQRVSRPPCCTVTRCDCTCTNTRASGLLRRSTVVRLLHTRYIPYIWTIFDSDFGRGFSLS